jgi:DNA replication protein
LNKQEEGKLLEKSMLKVMQEGTVAIPQLLLSSYPQLKLTDQEVMLLIHLLSFNEKRNEFPTIEEIQARMSSAPDEVIKMLQKLLKDGWISIDEEIDTVSGVQYERYNLDGVFSKVAIHWIEIWKHEAQSLAKTTKIQDGKDIFSVYEKEFARPLTPMELETITGWLDKDSYKEELILAALKEAVFAGKVHFRYIDQILLDWSRNRIFNVEQAKEHSQRFRGSR